MTTAAPTSTAETFRRSGPLMARRQQAPAGPLDESEKTLLQEATVAVVTELKFGRSAGEVEQLMTGAGWQPAIAQGFIQLVSQLLSRMYALRSWIFAFLTLFTGMIASMTVPMANAGEFPWVGAVLSVAVASLSLLATMRNVQLWRRYRRMKDS